MDGRADLPRAAGAVVRDSAPSLPYAVIDAAGREVEPVSGYLRDGTTRDRSAHPSRKSCRRPTSATASHVYRDTMGLNSGDFVHNGLISSVMATSADRGGSASVVVAVAITGLLSTVGAAALGGYWANQSVQRQFDSQRSAQIQDQRRIEYSDFLRTTTQLCLTRAESGLGPRVDAAVNEVLNQQGRVLLIASPSLRKSIENLAYYVIRATSEKGCDNSKYFPVRDAFIDAAKGELG